MHKLTFIIVNKNTKDLLDRCLANLLENTTESQIIVVDNESSDGSSEMVKDKYNDSVELIESENKGLAHGYNLGLNKSSNEFIIFLGTDAYPNKEALDTMLSYFSEHIDIGIITPRLVTADGNIDWDAHRGLITPWVALTHFSYLDRLFPKSKSLNGYFKSYEDMRSIHEIDACISHFMLTKKSILNSAGRWDEEFFLYGEDIDICYRVKRAGYKIIYMGNIEVLHLKGGTIGRKTTQNLNIGIKKDTKLRRFIIGQSTHAMGHFYKKNLWNKYPLPLSILVSLGIMLLTWLRLFIFDLKQFLKPLS